MASKQKPVSCFLLTAARYQTQSLSAGAVTAKEITQNARAGSPTMRFFFFIFIQTGWEACTTAVPQQGSPSWGTEQSSSAGSGTKTHGEGIRGAVNTQWPGGRTVSVAACASLLSKSELAHTMAVGAAFEALRATLDLLSQTKNGGSFSSS